MSYSITIREPHFHMCLFCADQYLCEIQHQQYDNDMQWGKESLRTGSRCCANCRRKNLWDSLTLQVAV